MRNSLAYVIFGTLIGYGLQLVVNHFVFSLPASVPKNLSEGEQFLAILRINGYRTVAISSACSVPFLLWLYRLIQGRQSVVGDS